jgi:hypothetical protein
MIQDVHLGSGSQIRFLIFYPSRVPDQGIKKAKKAPDPRSAILFASLEKYTNVLLEEGIV